MCVQGVRRVANRGLSLREGVLGKPSAWRPRATPRPQKRTHTHGQADRHRAHTARCSTQPHAVSHECHSHAVHSTSTMTHERQHTRCVGVCLKKASTSSPTSNPVCALCEVVNWRAGKAQCVETSRNAPSAKKDTHTRSSRQTPRTHRAVLHATARCLSFIHSFVTSHSDTNTKRGGANVTRVTQTRTCSSFTKKPLRRTR